MIEFFDTSALVKHYVREVGSSMVNAAIVRKAPVVSRIAHTELASAFARLGRDGAMPLRTRAELLRRVEADFTAFDIVELRPAIARAAAALVGRHPLRTLDALQLGSALALGSAPVRFWCADNRLARAAAAEGLQVLLTR